MNNYLKNQKKQFTNTIYEEKNMFFYDNAVDIIEAKDSYNKYLYLDILEKFKKGENNPKLNKQKKKKIEKDQHKESVRKSIFFKEVKPHHSNKDNIIPRLKTQCLSPKRPSKDFLTSRYSLSKFNTPKYKTIEEVITRSNKTGIDFKKHLQSAEKINSALETLTKFNTKLEGDIDNYKKSKTKIDFKSLIFPGFKTSFDNSEEIKRKLYDPKTRELLSKMQEDRYGKETLESRIKRIKYTIERSKARVTKMDELDMKIEKANATRSAFYYNNSKKIRNARVLKVPKMFSQNFDELDLESFRVKKCQSMINVNDVKGVYKKTNEKEKMQETFFENLSRMKGKVASQPVSNDTSHISTSPIKQSILHNLTNKLESIKKGVELVEKSNMKIKNQILSTRKKIQGSSLYINPKYIVPLDKNIRSIKKTI